MRVLVTGGLGFIGDHVVAALLARGDDVTILDARTPPVHDPASPREPRAGARFVDGDVRDSAALDRALDGCDAVVHLAAYQDYLPDHHRFFDVNTVGSTLLLERAVAAGRVARIVFASSESVYGEGVVDCPRDGIGLAAPRDLANLERGDFDARCARCESAAPPAPIPESAAAPVNAYGLSKLAAEQALFALAPASGVDVVALRYAIVHGAGQSPRNAYSGVLRAAIVRALDGGRPIVFEDGLAQRDYVAIDDVVSATLLALDDPRAAGRCLNVAGSRSWTVLELLEAVGRATGFDLEPELPGWVRVGDVRHTIGDTSALRGLGWEAKTDLADTWRTYATWLAGHRPPPGTVDRALERMLALGTLRPLVGARSVTLQAGS